MKTSRRSRADGFTLFSLVVVLALVATACGGGAGEEVAADGNGDVTTTQAGVFTLAPRGTDALGDQGEGTSDDPPPDDGEPQAVEFSVGEEVWHSGFRIEIIEGAVIPEEARGFGNEVRYALALRLLVENLGDDPAFFGPETTVTANTGAYVWESGFSRAGDVPGGLSDTIELLLKVDEGFDPSTATIIFGAADENRAVAPLGPGGDAAVRLEPQDVSIGGDLSMELIDLVFDGGDLRYDRIQRHSEAAAGKQALTLRFDIISRKNGNWSIFDNNFALLLSDGTALPVDGAELANISGSADGITTEDQFVRFLVDEGASGDFSLRFTPGSWFVGEDGVESATFDFTLP